MACRYLLLLLTMSALLHAALAEEVSCMTTLEDCSRAIGCSELVMTDDDVYCCQAGYSMRFDDDHEDCFCNKTSDVVACDVGAEACGNETQCCREGLHMQALQGYINGTLAKSCTCATSLATGYAWTSFTNGNDSGIHFVNYHGQPFAYPIVNTMPDNWFWQKLKDLMQSISDTFNSWW